MIRNISFIIPCIVCLVWVLVFLVHKRNLTQNMSLPLLLISSVYFFLFAFIFTPTDNYRDICIMDMIAIPLVLALLGSMAIFVHTHITDDFTTTARMQWLYIPAVAEGSVVCLLYYMIGLDNAAAFFKFRDEITATSTGGLFENLPKEFTTQLYRLFYLVDVTVCNAITTVLAFVVIMMCCYVFRKSSTTPSKGIAICTILILITVMPLTLIGRTYIIQNQWIGICISVLVSVEVFVMCHFESMSNLETFTLKDMFSIQFPGAVLSETALSGTALAGAVPSETALAGTALAGTVPSETALAGAASIRTVTLIDNVRKAFDEEKVWLDPELKLGELAGEFKTNRNKLSIVINHIYGKDFKSLVTERRIARAQQLMTEEPNATTDYIAQMSGFRDVTAFYHRFKDITGQTPTEWKLQR